MHFSASFIAACLTLGASAAPSIRDLGIDSLPTNSHEVRGLINKLLYKSHGPFDFTSTFDIVATPEQVVNATNAYTGGLPGAIGYFNFGLSAPDDVICYNITLVGFRGDYQSLAKTSTHIHQSAPGLSGPPRIAFPNPEPVGGPDSNIRRSIGCLKGPFETGIKANDVDTGVGFTIKMLEENPSAFNADTHSSLAVPGAVRGQFGDNKC
ncbi:CHRD domain-containing protein [Microdochium nivale]|nr:CHRD domain-containing protein [Microdochium nivale]